MSEEKTGAPMPTANSIKDEIAQTRDSLSQTLNAIEAKLNPPDLRERIEAELGRVEARAKALIHDELLEAKGVLNEGLTNLEGKAKTLLEDGLTSIEGKARQGFADAAVAIKAGVNEMKDSLNKDVRTAITDAKQSLRAATVGRVEELATTIGDTMKETKSTIIGTVRANPIPATLIGAGIVWMLVNRSRSASSSRSARSFQPAGKNRYRRVEEVEGVIADGEQRAEGAAKQAFDSASGVYQSAKGAVGNAMHGISDAAGRVATQAQTRAKAIAQNVSGAASRVATQAGQVYDRAQTGARQGLQRVNQGYNTTLQENPLVIAGAALAIGAIIGFALPRTRREDELLGSARDQLLRRAGQTAQDAAASLANLAEEALEGAQRSIQEPARA